MILHSSCALVNQYVNGDLRQLLREFVDAANLSQEVSEVANNRLMRARPDGLYRVGQHQPPICGFMAARIFLIFIIIAGAVGLSFYGLSLSISTNLSWFQSKFASTSAPARRSLMT